MNTISNNCCGGWYYKYNNTPYNNPFMWSITQYDSIVYLLQHFYDINWSNIKMRPTTLLAAKNTYAITIDSKVTINYVHAVFNPKMRKPTVIHKPNIGNDVEYCKIWEYIGEKYISRINRMMICNEPPSFILRPNSGNNNWTTDQLIKLINIQSPFKRVIITTDDTLKSDNILSKVIYIEHYGPHSNVIKNLLPEINEFLL